MYAVKFELIIIVSQIFLSQQHHLFSQIYFVTSQI